MDSDLDVLRIPEDVASSYRRIALISHSRHLERVSANALIVSTDWLAWRQARKDGRAAILLETMLDRWYSQTCLPDQLYLRAREWGFVGGEDQTLFHGVPLGALFDRSVALFDNAFARLWYGVDRAVERFGAVEIEFHGLRAELDLVSPSLQRLLVETMAARRSLALIDLHDPQVDDGNQAELDVGVLGPAPETRPGLREYLIAVVAWFFRLRLLLSTRPQVLLWSNAGTVLPLLAEYQSDKVVPVFIGAAMPKRMGLLWNWFRKGAVFADYGKGVLTAADHHRLDEIRKALLRAFEEPADLFLRARAQFIRDHILDSGWLLEMARTVQGWRAFFKRHRVARVMVGDITNSTCIVIALVARQSGAEVDELPNGMFVTTQRSPLRLPGHPGHALSRLLAWGATGVKWLSLSGGEGIPVTRVGYPALHLARTWQREKRLSPSNRSANVLVLPIYVDCDDAIGLRANIFAGLVDTVRALREAGYRNIRVKIHPAMPNPAYYSAVLSSEGLDVEFHSRGGLDRHLAWADFAVGPANSGGFVEALAAGVPYYVVLPRPSMIDPTLLGPAVIVTGGRQLIRTIDDGVVPDTRAILETLVDFSAIPNPCRRFWQVIEQDICGSAHPSVTPLADTSSPSGAF